MGNKWVFICVKLYIQSKCRFQVLDLFSSTCIEQLMDNGSATIALFLFDSPRPCIIVGQLRANTEVSSSYLIAISVSVLILFFFDEKGDALH